MNSETMLDKVRKIFGLKSLTYDPFNMQSLEEPIDVSYEAGRKWFFGPPIYRKKSFYKKLFRWETADGRKFMVMLDPHIIEDRFMPREDNQKTLCELIDKIKDTLGEDYSVAN